MKTTKQMIRTASLIKRKNFDKDYKFFVNEAIATKILTLVTNNQWKTVAIYASRDSEIDTWEIMQRMLDQQVAVYCPLITDYEHHEMQFKNIRNLATDFQDNKKLRILEPKQTCPDLLAPLDLDAFFVPVVAFDKNLNRVGMGGGYYDRWLLANELPAPKIGLAASQQLIEDLIPVEQFDVALNFCVTETEIFKLSN